MYDVFCHRGLEKIGCKSKASAGDELLLNHECTKCIGGISHVRQFSDFHYSEGTTATQSTQYKHHTQVNLRQSCCPCSKHQSSRWSGHRSRMVLPYLVNIRGSGTNARARKPRRELPHPMPRASKRAGPTRGSNPPRRERDAASAALAEAAYAG